MFGAVWFALVVPGMAGSEWWQGLSVYGKWVVCNAGMFAVITGLFGGLVSIILSHRLSVVQMLVNGLAGFMVFSFVLDVCQPPYVIDKAGTWLITGGDTLAEAASDFMVATAWEALRTAGRLHALLPDVHRHADNGGNRRRVPVRAGTQSPDCLRRQSDGSY